MTRRNLGEPAAILIVEDDQDIAQSLESLLADEGYRVAVAPDGVAALAAVERQRPDVVLLDVMLPNLDGVAVATELRRRGLGLEQLPLVLLSASPRLAEATRAVGTPFSLRKPFTIDEILAVIGRALA